MTCRASLVAAKRGGGAEVEGVDLRCLSMKTGGDLCILLRSRHLFFGVECSIYSSTPRPCCGQYLVCIWGRFLGASASGYSFYLVHLCIWGSPRAATSASASGLIPIDKKAPGKCCVLDEVVRRLAFLLSPVMASTPTSVFTRFCVSHDHIIPRRRR